jgi:hypothetical protein
MVLFARPLASCWTVRAGPWKFEKKNLHVLDVVVIGCVRACVRTCALVAVKVFSRRARHIYRDTSDPLGTPLSLNWWRLIGKAEMGGFLVGL